MMVAMGSGGMRGIASPQRSVTRLSCNNDFDIYNGEQFDGKYMQAHPDLTHLTITYSLQ